MELKPRTFAFQLVSPKAILATGRGLLRCDEKFSFHSNFSSPLAMTGWGGLDPRASGKH
jgi:hypothetical protein